MSCVTEKQVDGWTDWDWMGGSEDTRQAYWLETYTVLYFSFFQHRNLHYYSGVWSQMHRYNSTPLNRTAKYWCHTDAFISLHYYVVDINTESVQA